jgi:RNA recognition motif-containing protein
VRIGAKRLWSGGSWERKRGGGGIGWLSFVVLTSYLRTGEIEMFSMDVDDQLGMSLGELMSKRGGGKERAGKGFGGKGRGRGGGKMATSGRGSKRTGRQQAAAPYTTRKRATATSETGFTGSSKKRVFVGNLSWDISWQELKDHMRQAGEVEFADVLTYSDGRSSGGGIVQYSNQREAKVAIEELNDTELKDRLIFVREDRDGAGGKGTNSGGNSSKTVYVGNLAWDVAWQDLKDHMRQAGEVAHADVLTFPDGRSKGCGLVTFETAGQAKAATRDLTDSELNGRLIFVREDREEIGSSKGGKGGGKGTGKGGKDMRRVTSAGSKGGGGKGGGKRETSVYVGNIAWETSWQSLKDAFADYGCLHADVGTCFSHIPTSYLESSACTPLTLTQICSSKGEDRNGKARGFGIIKFASRQDAACAITEMNETEIDGRSVFVRYDEE